MYKSAFFASTCAFVVAIDDAVLFVRFGLFVFSNVEIINKEVASFDSSQYIAHRSCYVSDTMNPLKIRVLFVKNNTHYCGVKNVYANVYLFV